MPWTEKQKRLFFAKAARGEMSYAKARKYAREGTRRPVKRKAKR